ncbi:Proton-linked Monocarboxylate Transporter [Pleurotus pulmonarius]
MAESDCTGRVMRSPEEKDTETETQSVQSHPGYQVDGGYKAWATLTGGVLVVVVTFGYSNSFGVYQDVYTRSHAASASNVSWVGSTQLFFLLAMGLPAGKLLDMGYMRYTNLIGSLIYVFSLFMVSIAHPGIYYQVYLSQGIGLGIGAGLLYVPAVAVQAHHWRKHRALAMSAVAAGSSIGGIFFPIMLNQLFKSSVGFEWGVRASAFIVLGLLAVANLLMTDNPAAKLQAERPSMKSIFTDIPYVIITIGAFFILWGIFLPYFYLQLYAILQGVDPNTAFYTLAIMNAGSIPGRIIPGFLADRYGPFNNILPVLLANAVLIFALFGIHTLASTIVFAILYGFTSGAFLSLAGPVTASLARNSGEIGVRFGILYFISSFGALTGAPIAGALLGDTFAWSKLFIFGGVAMMVGFICFVVARQMLVKRKQSQIV